MKTKRMFCAQVAILCAALIVAACGAGGASGNAPATKATATTAPTATPKPKPSSLPQITLAFCQSVLTVDQANQIMNPSTPATMITVNADTNLGVCNYQSQNPIPVLIIDFEGWNGPIPISQADITAAANELVSKLGASGGTLNTFAAVSGVGDQAAFLAMTIPTAQFTIHTDVFYVLYGKVLFDCAVYNFGSLPPDATEQSALQQCAQHVVGAL